MRSQIKDPNKGNPIRTISNSISALIMLPVLLWLYFSGPASASGHSDQPDLTEREKISITITYATGDHITKEKTHEIIRNFQSANPDLEIIENLFESTGGYLESLISLKEAGQFPDIFECRNVSYFVKEDMLEPLSAENLSRFDNPVSVYGDVFTAPYMANLPYGIVYNKAFFREKGINAPPRTYGEFLDICEEIKASGMAPLVSGLADIWHMGFWFGKFWADSVGVENHDWIAARYAGTVRYSDDDFKSGLGKLLDLYRRGFFEVRFMNTRESQCISLMTENRAAMYYIGPWVFSQLDKTAPEFEYGFFPVPDDEGNVNLIGGPTSHGWAITKEAASDPKKAEAFNRFLDYFFEKNVYRDFLNTVGFASTTAEPVIYETSGAMSLVMDAYFDSESRKSLNWNSGVGANELPPGFRDWTYTKIQQAIMGFLTLDELVAEMDREWEKKSGDYDPSQNR